LLLDLRFSLPWLWRLLCWIWGSHGRGYEDYCVGFEVLTDVAVKITVLDLRFSRPWLWRLLCWIWGSHGRGYEDYCVGFEVLTTMAMKITVLDLRFSRTWVWRLLCWVWGSHDHGYEDYCVGFEVLTVETVKCMPLGAVRLWNLEPIWHDFTPQKTELFMRIVVFWDIISFTPADIYHHFVRSSCLHLQDWAKAGRGKYYADTGREISKIGAQDSLSSFPHSPGRFPSHALTLIDVKISLLPWRWRQQVPLIRPIYVPYCAATYPDESNHHNRTRIRSVIEKYLHIKLHISTHWNWESYTVRNMYRLRRKQGMYIQFFIF
jgi:hypothetical protein